MLPSEPYASGNFNPAIPKAIALRIEHPWWVERWIDLLQSYRFKKRLERGWRYAREGNVLGIEFRAEKVLAQVQGTDPQPYRVTISLEPFTPEDWQYLVATLATKAIYSAQLLAGEMPPDIEQVFAANGLSLFPFQLTEVKSSCSCPDPQNPCKHVAAVYYLLGDRFREDPFVLFQLRGQTRQQILQSLRQQSLESGANLAEPLVPSSYETPPLASFWQYDPSLSPQGIAASPVTTGAVWQVLPPLPVSKLEADLMKTYLQKVYQTLSHALKPD